MRVRPVSYNMQKEAAVKIIGDYIVVDNTVYVGFCKKHNEPSMPIELKSNDEAINYVQQHANEKLSICDACVGKDGLEESYMESICW